MSAGKVLLGVLAGVAAGALAGILFAPAKGSRTRRRIMRKGEQYADGLKAKLNDLMDTVTDKFDEVKEEVNEFATKNKEKLEEAERFVKATKS